MTFSETCSLVFKFPAKGPLGCTELILLVLVICMCHMTSLIGHVSHVVW